MEYMNRPWFVKDESHQRPGYCCLTIREEGTDRLIASLPEVAIDDDEKVAALREEARILTLSPELAFMLERFVYAFETKNEPKYSDGKLYREAKKAAYNLIDRIKGLK